MSKFARVSFGQMQAPAAGGSAVVRSSAVCLCVACACRVRSIV